MAATLVGLGVLIAGYSAWGKDSNTSDQKLANLYKIDQIEKTWHKAASRKNLNLMMSLWAPKATATIGGKTYTGKTAIRGLFAKSGPFQPQNHWESDTPAYKRRRHRQGCGRGRRRPRGAQDQRQVADHQPDRGNGDAEAVSL
ncbi:MAG: hypothetical protein E6G21_12685 [Actinobacteria bacterium]|nr:MAG: hypothetical protein E6G21_12685 [Actinomycetota bacterium]